MRLSPVRLGRDYNWLRRAYCWLNRGYRLLDQVGWLAIAIEWIPASAARIVGKAGLAAIMNIENAAQAVTNNLIIASPSRITTAIEPKEIRSSLSKPRLPRQGILGSQQIMSTQPGYIPGSP